MNKPVVSLIVCFLVLLSGCNEVQNLTDDQFSKKWMSAEINSAVSWWYLGQNQSHYILRESFPIEENIYAVSKSAITIIDIEPFEYKSKNKPVNLKKIHVVFK